MSITFLKLIRLPSASISLAGMVATSRLLPLLTSPLYGLFSLGTTLPPKLQDGKRS
jgi:hypothetical protein